MSHHGSNHIDWTEDRLDRVRDPAGRGGTGPDALSRVWQNSSLETLFRVGGWLCSEEHLAETERAAIEARCRCSVRGPRRGCSDRAEHFRLGSDSENLTMSTSSPLHAHGADMPVRPLRARKRHCCAKGTWRSLRVSS